MQKKITLVLFSRKSIHSSVFCSYLSRNTGLEIKHVSCKTDWLQVIDDEKKALSDEQLLVIDLENYPQICYEKIFTDADKHFSHWGTILVNVSRKQEDMDAVMHWPNCRGLFRANVSWLQLTDGFRKILKGEYWLPRGVMSELIEYYRNHGGVNQENAGLTVPALTRREEDILKLLATGISNAEMAEILFVSENTIKSHLYKMFKKIDVKNRSQARSWAKQHFL